MSLETKDYDLLGLTKGCGLDEKKILRRDKVWMWIHLLDEFYNLALRNGYEVEEVGRCIRLWLGENVSHETRLRYGAVKPRLKSYMRGVISRFKANVDDVVWVGEEAKRMETTVAWVREVGFNGVIGTYVTERSDPKPDGFEWRDLANAITVGCGEGLILAGMFFGTSKYYGEKRALQTIEPEIDFSGLDFVRQPIEEDLNGCVGNFAVCMSKVLLENYLRNGIGVSWIAVSDLVY